MLAPGGALGWACRGRQGLRLAFAFLLNVGTEQAFPPSCHPSTELLVAATLGPSVLRPPQPATPLSSCPLARTFANCCSVSGTGHGGPSCQAAPSLPTHCPSPGWAAAWAVWLLGRASWQCVRWGPGDLQGGSWVEGSPGHWAGCLILHPLL